MARTAQINYQRVTFSFPKDVLDKLRKKVGQNNMSKYVAEAVEEKLEFYESDVDDLFDDIHKLAEEAKKYQRDSRSSLEILREIRKNGK